MKKTTRIFLVLTATFLLFLPILLEAQEFNWAKRAGFHAFDYGYGICSDNSGNIYVTGKYEMDAVFDDTIVPCAGNHDIFTAKYSPSGELKWVRTGGGDWGDYGHALTCDDAGNVYVTGEIEVTVTFPGSDITLKSWGKNDIFVIKYTTEGELLWAQRAGGRESDKGEGVAVSNDAVYVTGYFRDTSSFNNEGAIKMISAGSKDMFLAKYSLEGQLLWVRRGGGLHEDEGTGITIDNEGYIYVTGFVVSEGDFSGVPVKTKGGYDAFLAKYDSNGNLIWVKTVGSYRTDKGMAVKAGKDGRIYLTGSFKERLTVGSSTITSKGDADIFVACFTKDGEGVWAKRAGGELFDTGLGIDTDEDSNVYITGFFAYEADFNEKRLTAPDSADVFVAKYNSNGDFQWVLHVEGKRDFVTPYRSFPGQFETEEAGRSVFIDKRNFVLVTGSFRTDGIFGDIYLPAWSNTNIFLTKIKQAESDESDYVSSDTTGTISKISEVSFAVDLDIFPNPANTSINIQYSGNLNEKTMVTLQAMDGRIIKEESFLLSRGHFLMAIDDVSPGVYLLVFQTEKENFLKKIIINR
jgi:hypothetical protein